jgi:hypothetical protein
MFSAEKPYSFIIVTESKGWGKKSVCSDIFCDLKYKLPISLLYNAVRLN